MWLHRSHANSETTVRVNPRGVDDEGPCLGAGWGTWSCEMWLCSRVTRATLDIENNIDLNIFSYIQVQKYYLL